MSEEAAREALQGAEALLQARELEAAEAAYEQALLAGADAAACSGARWLLAMLRGDFEAAWRESDAIRARGDVDPHRFWQGEDFAGKRVMLRCLHGFGDTVQFMRYAPLLAARAASLTVEVAPPMQELTRMFEGASDVITWGAEAPGSSPEWDVQMEVNELPYIFRTQPAELPVATQYLVLERDVLGSVDAQARRAGRPRVGVVWASGQWNVARSVDAALLAPVLETEGVEFWNLQGGESRDEWNGFRKGPHMHDAEEAAESVVGLAALIAQMDLVITPDTLAAHLAGALGTPAWVMLAYAADWRWQHGRDDSPWYPTLRLFRQRRPGDWQSVVDAVRGELERLAARSQQKEQREKVA